MAHLILIPTVRALLTGLVLSFFTKVIKGVGSMGMQMVARSKQTPGKQFNEEILQLYPWSQNGHLTPTTVVHGIQQQKIQIGQDSSPGISRTRETDEARDAWNCNGCTAGRPHKGDEMSSPAPNGAIFCTTCPIAYVKINHPLERSHVSFAVCPHRWKKCTIFRRGIRRKTFRRPLFLTETFPL